MRKKQLKKKRFIVPAIASTFIAGFGQILKGESKKGLKLMLWFYFGFPITVTFAMMIHSYLFLAVSAIIIIIYPIIWIYNVFDALTSQIR